MKTFKVVITWIDKSITVKYQNAKNHIQAEHFIYESLSAIEKGMYDKILAQPVE